MRVPSVISHALVHGVGAVPDWAGAVAPPGQEQVAGHLPWRLHRVDLDGAELNFALAAADGAGLAGARGLIMAAVAESVLIRPQEEANTPIGPE